MPIWRAVSRSVAVVAAAILIGSAAPAQANPVLLGQLAATAAQAIVMIGSYLVVANTHGSSPPGRPSGLATMAACREERDGSMICWPAAQGIHPIAIAPIEPPPPAGHVEVGEIAVITQPPGQAETP
ncbi:MAG TPA: hypothetical protein VMT79_05240 [Candidatus Binatia bacterium]|nr:hypothetical protein [Candidatus Binatia bacterium]